MRRTARSLVAVALAAALTAGLDGCDSLPEIDPSRLPDITSVPLPTDTAGPAPEPTAPEPTEAVTEEPEPVPTETDTEEPEPEPTATAAPSEEPAEEPAAEEDATVWWPWVLAALVALVIIVAIWRFRQRRRAWDKRLSHAAGEMSWLEESLIPQVLSKPSAAEASTLWRAARPRVLELDRELHDLGQSGPTDARTAAAGEGSQVLGGLAAAVDAETSTEPGMGADALRASRAQLDQARAQARGWIEEVRR
ncbi:hypothetical protein [Demequina activiva]|uniref:Uncharacterized protein n=1 Tax=Demequina activiva TaxID=1582364 RepID=A0A919Q330_9MICO|nr:hypothetical protein [Demequina activiva]GIG54347.1 hypothetical protein Dac01nite_10990 [Demequina activiva]